MAGASWAVDGEIIVTIARNKHTSNAIHFFIVLLLCLRLVFAR